MSCLLPPPFPRQCSLANAPPADQIRTAQATLALAPNDLDVLTVLGTNQILQGDAAAGEQALRRAVAANPGNIGLRFQLARALVILVHGALEHDLRTLPGALRMVRAMGAKEKMMKVGRT